MFRVRRLPQTGRSSPNSSAPRRIARRYRHPWFVHPSIRSAVSINSSSSIYNILREGNLARAEVLASQLPHSDPATLMLRCEVLFLAGHSKTAAEIAKEVLPKLSDKEDLKALALFVLGACAWEMSDEHTGMEQLERAELHAKNCANWSLVSRIRLQMLERSSDSAARYHISLPLCSAAIRSVHKSGDHQILADAHITFARLETRAGGFQQAMRHLHHANRLLREEPNRRLAAGATLTWALILAHQGDLQNACDKAERAALEAA